MTKIRVGRSLNKKKINKYLVNVSNLMTNHTSCTVPQGSVVVPLRVREKYSGNMAVALLYP